jgi:hypothetical protein
MNHGLELTQSEVHRKKHVFRLFFEERILDVGHVILSFFNSIADLCDFTINLSKSLVKFVLDHKRYAVVALVAVVIIFAMVF